MPPITCRRSYTGLWFVHFAVRNLFGIPLLWVGLHVGGCDPKHASACAM
jgi:hypothetical protein